MTPPLDWSALGPGHPSRVTAADLDVTDAEFTLLTRIAEATDGAVYGDGTTADRRAERLLPGLAVRGLVHYLDAATGGWERGMWGAFGTCLGLNAVYRRLHDRHVTAAGCSGSWRPDGSCTGCGAARPLDHDAYETYLAAVAPEIATVQARGPRLWCREHGWMRTRDISTAKVCLLPGTCEHDGGLDRV